jgi:hypothetical protein
MLELREMKGLILLKIFSQSRNRECWTNGRKVGKSLKQEGFRTPSSIFPRNSISIEEWRTERKLITTVSRIISWHYRIRAHLKRFSIVDGSMCVCLEDHKTVNHIIWKCPCFSSQRAYLIQRLLLSGVYEETSDTRLVCPIVLLTFSVGCGVKM